ncbi:MAG TPA: hypothetical protein VK705_03995, partial [Ferruginibacter sp.]|nr:hypothetical protein [Ferruginibacter sp.]
MSPRKLVALLLSLFFATSVLAQTTIVDNNIPGDASAILELQSADKGFLLPKVPLTATTSIAPLIAPVAGMEVYNTITSAPGANAVTPGVYYYNGLVWVREGSDNSWLLTGNKGTVDGTNFIGTTDNVPLNFRVNNITAGRVDNIYENTALGFQALKNNVLPAGVENTAIGNNALEINTTGYFNVALGSSALVNNTSGGENMAIGYHALNSNTGPLANDNVAIGYLSLDQNTFGANNTGVGQQTLFYNSQGSNNTAIGSSAGVIAGSGNLSYATAIGADAQVSQSNSLVLGEASGTVGAVNVGIGTSAPKNKLEIVSNTLGTSGLMLANLTTLTTPAPSGNVLSLDGANNVILVPEASTPVGPTNGNFWSLIGNKGTNPTVNFIGTGDNEDVVFERNGVRAGFLGESPYINTSWGVLALNPASTGIWNVAIGGAAMQTNTSGTTNTAVGEQALENNTTGNLNVAIGYNALQYNSGGGSNVAI